MAVKIGMALPQFGERASTENIVRVAEGAERIGLDSVWVMDRLLRPCAPVSIVGSPPVALPSYYATVFDPIETLTFVAARTSRLLLGTSAILATLQPPVVLARRLATLDQLSGGRLIVGLVQGWMADELAAANVPPGRRGPGFDEYLAVLRAVWGPDPVAFEGRHYRVAESEIGPKPRRPGGLPIYMGYTTEAGIRRAGRVADGLHPYVTGLAALRRDVELFRAAAQAAGRDPATLDVILRADGRLTAEPEPGGERPLFRGSLSQWLDDLAEVEAAGVGHVLFGFDAPVAEQLQTMERLRSHVRPS